jgi:cytochrome c oxidase subunit 1
MPRRYFDYLPQFETGEVLSTIGGFVLFVGIIMMIANLIRAARHGEQAPDNPWGGKTLEWTIPSPPPMENFDTPPVVSNEPYDYE